MASPSTHWRVRSESCRLVPVSALVAALVALLLGLGACHGGEKVAEGPCCSASHDDPAAVDAACDGAAAAQTDCQEAGAAVANPTGAAAGMRAYVDPETGELLDHPPAGAAPMPAPPAADRSSATPKVKPAPGGGVMIEDTGDLRQY